MFEKEAIKWVKEHTKIEYKASYGEFPKEQQLVLLYRENSNGANVALSYWYKSYVNDKVIAWKEIVLPKESKEK